MKTIFLLAALAACAFSVPVEQFYQQQQPQHSFYPYSKGHELSFYPENHEQTQFNDFDYEQFRTNPWMVRKYQQYSQYPTQQYNQYPTQQYKQYPSQQYQQYPSQWYKQDTTERYNQYPSQWFNEYQTVQNGYFSKEQILEKFQQWEQLFQHLRVESQKIDQQLPEWQISRYVQLTTYFYNEMIELKQSVLSYLQSGRDVPQTVVQELIKYESRLNYLQGTVEFFVQLLPLTTEKYYFIVYVQQIQELEKMISYITNKIQMIKVENKSYYSTYMKQIEQYVERVQQIRKMLVKSQKSGYQMIPMEISIQMAHMRFEFEDMLGGLRIEFPRIFVEEQQQILAFHVQHPFYTGLRNLNVNYAKNFQSQFTTPDSMFSKYLIRKN